MKQSFALATLVTLTLSSPIVYALGLGQPAVHSYLRAPLNVSIPLVDAGAYDPEQLRVSVADRSAFQAAGLDWKSFAASIKADIHVGSGTPEVRLTSSAPANTPWLDLLLTLTTPDGDVTQDVTLLFDAPVYDKPGDGNKDDANPGAEGQGRAQDVVKTSDSAASSTQVKNGDTLWNVAERLKPARASIEQVMLALVVVNPGAFPSGNINGMNAGFKLKVPTTVQMLERSKAQAAQTIDYMNTAWRIRGPNGPVHVPLGLSSEANPQPAEPDGGAEGEAAVSIAALSSRALLAARQLGEGVSTSELAQQVKKPTEAQAKLERITGQRDRLREEVSQLKAEMSQLTDELALQEVELARQEVRGAAPLPELPAKDGAATSGGSAVEPVESDAMPPISELAIARRGMLTIATEYRWPLTGAALLLLVMLVLWRYRRRPPPPSPEVSDDDENDMLGKSQAAGRASSRDEARVEP